jgi:nucleoside-diphosphate-sugar epimerase
MQPTWQSKVRDDVVGILDSALLSEFQNKSVTILGGSGFLGRWVLSYFLEAKRLNLLDIELNVLTRNPSKISLLFPEFTEDLRILNVDLSSFDVNLTLPKSDFFIHAATPTVASTGFNDGPKMVSSVVRGAELIINSADLHSNFPRVIHLSSGIVYQHNSSVDEPILEKPTAPKIPGRSFYETAKLIAEQRFERAVADGLIQAANPRLFAFIGPGLSLTDYFAAGNFMDSVIGGKPIAINGNPLTARSYMYPTDLVTWLLTILVKPSNQPINIGGNHRICLQELAEAMVRLNPKCQIVVNDNSQPANYYYPSTELTKGRYGVTQLVTLEDGLARWLAHLKK